MGNKRLPSAKPTALQRQEMIDWVGGRDEYIRFHNQSPGAGLVTEL